MAKEKANETVDKQPPKPSTTNRKKKRKKPKPPSTPAKKKTKPPVSRAEIPGHFHALPTKGYGMYAPDLYGTAGEMRVRLPYTPIIE